MSYQEFSLDYETGEVTFYNINRETGERLLEIRQEAVPVHKPTSTKRSVLETSMFPNAPKNKKLQLLKKRIMSGSSEVSYRMILLICVPISVMFSSLVAMLLVLSEIFLHVRCHKINKALKSEENVSVYFRSPFHVVTSVFCASCRESASASKVGLLQDQRRYRYDYLKGLGI